MSNTRRLPRTLDPTLPPTSSSTTSDNKNTPTFPLPYSKLPSEISNLKECALHQINHLQSQISSYSSSTKEEQEVDDIEEIEDALDDGFLLCDLLVIRRKLKAWRTMFPRIKPFFALKCNPDVMVAAVLGLQHPLECGFDCASLSEIRLALLNTHNDTLRLLYANPQRSTEDLHNALSLNIDALTFDTSEELRKIHSAYQNELLRNPNRPPPEVILRLLVPDAHSAVPLGQKFGAPFESVKSLALEACELNLDLIGVSFHCGSGCHDPQAYATAIRMADDAIQVVNDILRRYNRPECCLLDIGGGFPGMDGCGADHDRFSGQISKSHSPLEEKETTMEIAKIVTPLVNQLFPSDSTPIHIIAEPGRYFVEEAFALCCRIYTTKVMQQRKRHYYIAQGVQGVFKDVLLCNETFVPIPLRMEENLVRKEELFPSIVHGPSGEQFDVVCENCMLPELKEGDWLLFDRMGAYTLSIAPRSGKLPIRYVMGGGEWN